MIRLNQIEISPTIFPDLTSQIWKIDEKILNNTVNCIKWDFYSEDEFMHIAQLKMLLNTLKPGIRVTLDVPYFPYARQDHAVSNSTTFALRSFCLLLNSLKFDNIVTQDIHSNVAFEYLDNLTSNYPETMIDSILWKFQPDIIVFPDKGAEARYKGRFDLPSISIHKEREQTTGHLTIKGIINEDNIDLENKKFLIVDDLCDGGMTFILVAQELYRVATCSVGLYTTHGIYSKGTDVLFDNGISRIFNIDGEVER